jgi:hypothetical protein
MSGEDQFLAIWSAAEAARVKRAEDMPTESDAMRAMQEAYARLTELGWASATYSPKDGSVFEALEAGCTRPGHCHYMGEWPTGGWWMHDAGDLWPSRPILWRKLPDNARDKPPQVGY